jgi:hypothetical protein
MGACAHSMPSGHVSRRRGARGDVWYAKYRLPDGRQVQKRIGPAWTKRGRPAPGFFTKRTAEAWLSEVLEQARRGELAGMVRTGATFSDAVAEYMRWLREDRQRKPSTLRDYRSIINAHLLPAFGTDRLEDITAEQVEAWSAKLAASGQMNNRTRLKILTVLHGVMKRAVRVWKLPRNPISDVEKPIQRRSVEIEIFSPEEVMALVRHAASEQDAAIYLVAAFTLLDLGHQTLGVRGQEPNQTSPSDLNRRTVRPEPVSILDSSACRATMMLVRSEAMPRSGWTSLTFPHAGTACKRCSCRSGHIRLDRPPGEGRCPRQAHARSRNET